MRFRVLGTLELTAGAGWDVGPTVALRSAKLRRLLAALLLSAGEVVSADRLADMVWSRSPPADPSNALHTLISRLRNVLDEPASSGGVDLLTAAPGYLLRVDRDHLDSARFEDLLAEARSQIPRHPQGAVELLEEALGLWRGPAYAEFADEEFAQGEAVRLEELRLSAVEDWVDVSLALGRARDVVGRLEALVAQQPLRERPRRQLMLALYQMGRAVEALEVYRSYRERLGEELGVEPSPGLARLHTAILRQDPNLDRSTSGPQELDHPSSPPGPSAAAVIGNLPTSLTALVGREEQLVAVADTLAHSRVVTMTGMGGVGKTRLALQAAADARDSFAHGVWLCELGTLGDPGEVDHVVASVLGVRQRQGLSALERLVEFLRGRHLLLVVDNCEHVLEAAARLVDAVVRDCSGVSVLATSREPLGVEGEQILPVPPLALPDLSPDADALGLRAVDSVALFCKRAEAAQPDFALSADNAAAVAEICRRLDGVPLALELAASRVRALTPAEIADRLHTRFQLLSSGRRTNPVRQRSLRSVVDWSYQLLSEGERRVFERLAVFAGDFDLCAAEHVCGDAAGESGAVAEVVASLVDKSLLTARPHGRVTRYALLETLRDYGRERIEEQGDTQTVCRLHAEYYVRLSEQAQVGLRGRDEARWVTTVGRDLHNLRAAHAWAVTNDLEIALRLSASLVLYAEHGMTSEIFSWADRTAQAATAHRWHSPLLPVVWASAAIGACMRGELARARELAQRGLAASLGPNDPARRYALLVLGDVALFEGRLDQSACLCEEAAALSRDAEDLAWASWALARHVLSHAYRGANDEAVRLADDATRIADATANPTAMGAVRYAAGESLLETDPDRAIDLLDDSIHLGRSVHNDLLVGVALVSAASLRGRRGHTHEALRLFREVIEYWHSAGNCTQQWTTMRNVIELLSRVGAAQVAATLYGALTAADTAAPLFGADAERLSATVQRLQQQLGPDGFCVAVAAGEKTSGADAVALACQTIDEMLARAATTPC